MPLPQKVIEALSRESAQTPGWSGQLLMFSGTLFAIALFVYLGIIFGYRPYLNSEARKLNSQIQAFSQKIPISDQENIIRFYSQLVNVQSLLKNHVAVSPLFGWLEKNTQANVYLTRLSVNVPGRQAAVSGVAKTMEDVAEQLAVFERAPEVDQVNVGNISLGATGAWQFDAALLFRDRFFTRSGIPQSQPPQ